MTIIILLLSLLTGKIHHCDSWIASEKVTVQVIVGKAISSTFYKKVSSSKSQYSIVPNILIKKIKTNSFQNIRVLEQNKGPSQNHSSVLKEHHPMLFFLAKFA